MEGIDLNLFQQAIRERNWPMVASFVILLIVRLAKLPFFGNYWEKVPKQYRPAIPFVLGLLSGVGDALFTHQAWPQAIFSGFMSGLGAIGLDQVITKTFAKQAGAVPPVVDSEKTSDEGTKT